MQTPEFESIVNEQIDRCTNTLVVKAREYATEDRLHNFKLAANLNKTTLRQALAGMMIKHTVSVYDLCRNDDLTLPMEIWDEKITDHINYLILLRAAVVEERKGLAVSNESATA